MDQKERQHKAGHYEVHGETIAKFEFFENGWNPYSRYLDVDKVDLILRKRDGEKIIYKEIQVKFGRLYKCTAQWQKNNFDYTSWRFFKMDDFANAHANLYVAYVMAHPGKYNGDIFIFPAREFHRLICASIQCNTKKGLKAKMCIAHLKGTDRWFLWKTLRFSQVNSSNTIEVTRYRRNFKLLEKDNVSR